MLLNLVNRLMAGAPAAADVAQPAVSGRTLARYALGTVLRLWGDGILNRAAELERERAFEEADAARQQLATVTREVEDARLTARLLGEEIELQERRLKERQEAFGVPFEGHPRLQWRRDTTAAAEQAGPVVVTRYPDAEPDAQPAPVAGEGACLAGCVPGSCAGDCPDE